MRLADYWEKSIRGQRNSCSSALLCARCASGVRSRLPSLALAMAFVIAPRLASAADLFNNTNIQSVANCPAGSNCSPTFTLTGPAQVTQLADYHWNNHQGAPPGTITLQTAGGQPIGTFQATPVASPGVPNANWVANVNLVLQAGVYRIIDSSPATWSQNAQSHHQGFAIVRGSYLTGAVNLADLNLTHYHCYQANGPSVNKRVSLKDQFQQANPVFVATPALLCAPVQKNEEPTQDLVTHLACYVIEGARGANKRVRISNQFGTQFWNLNASQFLCVPSQKDVQPDSTTLTPQPPCLTSPPGPPGVRYGTQNLALGATLQAGVRQDVTLLVNTSQTSPALFQFGVGGPTSPVLEICVATGTPTLAQLGSRMTWNQEDPCDAGQTPPNCGKNTPWSTQIFSQIAGPLQNQPASVVVNGSGVIKIDLPASNFKAQLLNLNQTFPGYPSGRAAFILQLPGGTFTLGVTIGQE